ncbi:GH25 family lysozyme [Amycolatopsis sp. NPDC098790]|uniref:GH25 family lysozyme n=1 Tax=Amycolatopsis sp. NPDC098790 TaxID=3363939 RepID=UPI00381BACE8
MRKYLLAVLAGAVLLGGTPAAIAEPMPTDVPNGSAKAARETHAPAARAAGLPPGYSINGIDVSSHDHASGKTVNWANQKAAGDEFAFVKATEGTGYTNPYFDQDYHGAKNAGLYTGAYAFGRPDLGNAVGQANYFVDHLQWATDGRTLPPFLDLEWPYSSLNLPDCYGLGQSDMRTWISSFLNQVKARIGRTPMIYTNVNWWNPCTGGSTAFSGYPLDIASCNSAPPSVPGWGTRWTFWQYDIDACGRGAAHDSNVFNGSLAQLAALAGGSGGGANGVSAGDVTGDGRADLVARMPDGSLSLYKNNGSNTSPYDSGTLVGSSWQGFSWFRAGDVTGDHRADIVAAKPDGSLWLYTNNGSSSPYDTGTLIGSAWQQFSNVTLADVTGDGRADLVAAKPDGTLWLYTNNGSNTSPYSTGIQVGAGWEAFTSVLGEDVTGDHRADLVAAKPDGTLWLYTNGGSDTAPYSSGTQVGAGWAQFDRIQAGDVTGDGRADLTATKPDGTLWLYTNGGSNTAPYGSGTLIGSGWQNFA